VEGGGGARVEGGGVLQGAWQAGQSCVHGQSKIAIMRQGKAVLMWQQGCDAAGAQQDQTTDARITRARAKNAPGA